MNKSFFQDAPRLFAHRGLSVDYPENTLISFKRAFELGVDVIETDIHLTRDNRFAVIHDERLERVSDGTGVITEYTMAELKKFDAGYNFTRDNSNYPFRGTGLTILSLDELLSEFPEQRFNIDLKDNNPAQVKYYADLIMKHSAQDRVLTASEHRANLREVRKLFPGMATSFSRWEVIGFYFLFKTGFMFVKRSFNGDALQIPEYFGSSLLAGRPFIRQAHEKGLRVHVWTINSEEDMRRLLDAGVDGIFTDDSKLLKRVLCDK